jgi:hypothetical protein
LLDDKFSSYNNLARPVLDPKDKIELSIGLKLSQIADIVIFWNLFSTNSFFLILINKKKKDEKNQIMTTNGF